MNIYQTVLDTVTLSTDITESAGFINIKGTSPIAIPKGRIMGAKRVLAGERAQAFTVTAPGTVSNSVTYTVTVSGKSAVTGVMKSFYSTYTTAASGNTDAGLAASLAAGFATTADVPFTVSYSAGATSFIITAKSGTPVISVAVSPNVGSNLLSVSNTTTAITSTANITTAGVISASAAPFTSEAADLGKMVTVNNGTTYYTGIIKTFTNTNSVTATPNPSAAITGNTSKLYAVDNTGATLENTYAYSNLPGVTLAPTTRYVIYEIDAIAPSYAGNGARPDSIDGKYIIYVNAADTNVWTSTTGFDAFLATLCGLYSF